MERTNACYHCIDHSHLVTPHMLTVSPFLSPICTPSRVAQIWASAKLKLAATNFNAVIDPSMSMTKEEAASTIACDFFGTMLSQLPGRAREIVRNAERYNSSSDGANSRRHILGSVQEVIRLVKLYQRAEEAGAIMPGFDVDNVRDELTRELGMKSRDALDWVLQKGAMPAAMVRIFGKGSVLFWPEKAIELTGTDPCFDCSPAALGIAGVLRDADTFDYIYECAKLLEDKIIRYLWDEVKFPWDTEKIKDLQFEKVVDGEKISVDLETALEVLAPVEGEA